MVSRQTGSREVQEQDAQPGIWERNDGCSERLQAGASARHIKRQLENVSCNCGAPNDCLRSQVLLVQLSDCAL